MTLLLMNKHRSALLCLVILLFPSQTAIGRIGHGALLDQIPLGHVLIINRSSTSKVVFYLRKGKQSKWSKFALDPKSDNLYKDVDEILIKTGRIEVHYSLKDARRYGLVWNESRKLWDLVEHTSMDIPL